MRVSFSVKICRRPPRSAAETGNGVAEPGGLVGEVGLHRVITMEPVARSETMADVERPLIVLHRGIGVSDEPGRARLIDEVCTWHERDQLRDRGVGDRGTFRLAQDEAVDVEPLSLSQALITDEEKRPVSDQRPPEAAAELVALEGGRIRRGEGEEVACIQGVVAQELEQLPTERIGARARRDVHDCAGGETVFGAEGRVLDLELLHSADRGLEGDRAERQIVQRDAVDHEVDGFLAVAGGVERQSFPDRARVERRNRSAAA